MTRSGTPEPWPVISTQHTVRDPYDSEGGWLTREGIATVCWICDADVYEHKPGQHNDVWRCKSCGTIWEEPHR